MEYFRAMNLSYWEIKSWLTNIDYTIVGSGIVGLNCALNLKERFPKANILVIEKGTLPQGASTKNAGFACFGSLSEIISDLSNSNEAQVFSLVKTRVMGLKRLRKLVGTQLIDFQEHGGFELFLKQDTALFEKCLQHKNTINTLLKPLFKTEVFSEINTPKTFKEVLPYTFFNAFEGQLDTGKLMQALLKKARAKGIALFNGAEIKAVNETSTSVCLEFASGATINTNYAFVATNGFAKEILKVSVKPARAQVLITEKIPNLNLQGTYHLDRGYYYFRNVGNRILLGGGRQLDIQGETTTKLQTTAEIQHALEQILFKTIIPNKTPVITDRWSGIMGVGTQKTPIVKPISSRVFCGVRLGGMGVAIGSQVGADLANLLP